MKKKQKTPTCSSKGKKASSRASIRTHNACSHSYEHARTHTHTHLAVPPLPCRFPWAECRHILNKTPS